MNIEIKHEASVELSDYGPYQWFIGLVGGPRALIPANHYFPLTLRMHHHEITDAIGTDDIVNPETKSLIRVIDRFTNFNHRLPYQYPLTTPIGFMVNEMMAHEFFQTRSIGPQKIQGIIDSIYLQELLARQFMHLDKEMYPNAKYITEPNRLLHDVGKIYADVSAEQEIDNFCKSHKIPGLSSVEQWKEARKNNKRIRKVNGWSPL
jgi:hypothetical protein